MMAMTSVPQIGELSGKEKKNSLTRLLDVLQGDLKCKSLLPPQRNALLEELKVYTRSGDGTDPLFSEEGVRTVCAHGFDGNSLNTGRIALRCLANIMLLRPKTRQTFIDLGYAPKAVECLKHDDLDDEFLASRLLFMCTYETTYDFDVLLSDHGLAEGLNTNLRRHARHFCFSSTTSPFSQEALSLTETLKLLFNLCQFYPSYVPTFTKSMLPILKILKSIDLPVPVLQAPITYLINALLNLDLEDARGRHFPCNPLFPKFDPTVNVSRLVTILDAAVHQSADEALEKVAVPLLTLLRRVHEFAPDAARARLGALLLPSEEERAKPLGQSDALPGRLLRLSTSAMAPQLRDSIQNLLFELSGKDATRFVKNVGYGFAAGFLMNHDMPIPQNPAEAWSTSRNATVDATAAVGEEGGGSGDEKPDGSSSKPAVLPPTNPITGQRLDMEEEVDEGPPMTDEEKEREAERLFVLFERLRATGVVNVQNPVTKARDEGRLEELE